MAKRKFNPDSLEQEFARQCEQYRLPAPVRQLLFAMDTGRRWRFDFAWPEQKLAVELHGLIVIRASTGEGIVRGGHGTVGGMVNDMDKNNAAILLGWSVLVFCQQHVHGDAAINMTMRALAVKGYSP